MTQHHVFSLPHRVTAEIDIDAPIDEVFSYVTDPHNLIHWYQGVTEVHDVSASPGVGQRFTWTAHFLGRRLEATHEVENFNPPTEYAVRSEHGGHHFQFERLNNGTRVTVNVAVHELHFLARVAEPLIVRTARRHEQHSLETLKDLLETHGTDHPR